MEWKASWIWDSYHQETANFYMYFRKVLYISNKIINCKSYCTCSSEYKLYINGKYIGRGPNPCDPRWQYYDEYDIKGYLHPGKNVIAVLCYHCGVGTHSLPYAPGGFLFQGEITYSDSHKILISSDDSWKVTQATAWIQNVPQIFWPIGFQEIYNSQKEIKGWMEPDFDDSSWQNARVLGFPPLSPWINLIPREIPMLKETKIFPPKIVHIKECQPLNFDQIKVPNIAFCLAQEQKGPLIYGKVKNPTCMLTNDDKFTTIETPKSGYSVAITIDFGKEVVGYPNIEIDKAKEGIIDIGYSEALDKDGNVNPPERGINQADRLIVSKDLKNWSTFNRRAFRYMQLTFRSFNQPVSIKTISLDFTSYPVKYKGSFECSDALLNKIWKTGRYTLELCMQDHFEDCPSREHAQYPGDMRVEALENYYAFGDTKLIAKGLRQLVQSQDKDGWFKAVYPSGTNHKIVDYCAVWVMALWDYYLYTGDLRLVKELYPNLCKVMDWFKKQTDEYKLINATNKKDWWVFINWGDIEKEGEITAFNCFYYKALLDATNLALAVGDKKKSNEFNQLRKEVKKYINQRLWSEEKDAYIDCFTERGKSNHVSQETNYLAILFGIADPPKWSKIYSCIHNKKRVKPIRTAYFNFYALEALFYTGEYTKALSLIRDYWGEMLRRGATTWWENFDLDSPPDSIPKCSLCHGWSAAPTFSLSAQILGVKPTKPGYKEFCVKPKPVDISWAKGVVPTPYGDISVNWSKNKEMFEIKVLTIENCKADIAIPSFNQANLEITLNKKLAWSKGNPNLKLSEVKRTYKEKEYVHFIVEGKGIYHFVSHKV